MFDKMDLLFLSFTLLFWTSFVNVNGYAFDGSRSTFFAFSNTEMPMDELKQLGNRLYLENSEKLSVVCCLVDKKNWSLSKSKELAKKYAAGGLLPYITFKNKTWWKTYKFPAQNGIPSVHWRLEISRDKFSRGPTDVIFEPWFVTVELGLGLGLFETRGILIPKEPLMNISLNLGSVVDSSVMVNSTGKFVVKPAPCCSDISFVLPSKNKTMSSVAGCYIGITFGAFAAKTVQWLNLCTTQDNNRSLCRIFPQMDCSKLRLLDFVVTRNYIILATSFGLVRSASFTELMSGRYFDGENFQLISSTHTLLGEAFSGGSVEDEIEFQHTLYCLDFHVFDDKDDWIYLLYGNSDKSVLVYKSESPFNQLLEISPSNMPLSSFQVLGLVTDLMRNTNVLLVKSTHEKLQRYSVLVVSKEESNDTVFPPWYFSDDSVASYVYSHTWSNTLFIYGSQVWQSRDGGNSFNQLTELTLKQIFTSLSLPQYGDSVVAMTDHGMIFNGRVGISRLVPVYHQPFEVSLQLVVMDELENIAGFFQNESSSSHLFGNYFVHTIHFESHRNHFCDDHVLLQLVSDEDVLLFIPAPSGYTNLTMRRYCLGNCVVGQVVRSRLGGSAHITEITYLNSSYGFFTKVRGKIIKPFTSLSSVSEQVLDSSIRLRLVDPGTYPMLYEINIRNGNNGWSRKDEGKTVVLLNGLSILLTKYVNESTMYGVPPSAIPHSSLLQGTQGKRTWQLYDMRSAELIVQRKGDPLLLSRSLKGYEASATFNFNSTHVGMVLMITNDNFGVIEVVKDASRVAFMNNSNMKEGNYSEWRLYQPSLNITEIMSYDFYLDTGFGMWWVEEKNCASFSKVTSRQYKTLYHLDSRDDLSLEFSVLGKYLEDNDPQVTMLVGNPSLFRIQSTYLHSGANHTLKVDLERKPGTSGLSLMSFNARDMSLNCPRVSNVYAVHGGCPPSRRLVFKYPYTFPPKVFLYDSPFDDEGILRRYKLPANYRPPSSRGIGIPMSSNLYNVFPEKPPDKEIFTVSRETRLYKQCQDKSFRQDCGCDADQLSMSSLIAHSDCINTVYRLIFSEIFKPKFVIMEDDAFTKPFQDPYYLVELNQRCDYRVLRGTDLSVSAGPYRTVLQDNLNSSLEFSGSGLYHFRAYGVQEGFTLCELRDEFIVFVDEMPLPHPARDIVRVATAMVFVSTSFLAYLWFFYLSKKGELNRVFGEA